MDLIDGTRAAASLPHLADCAACREQLDDLRATLREVAAVDVPEPPPEYWRRLSARVHDAVRREPARGRWGAWWLGLRFRDVAWPMAAAAVLLLAVLVMPRRDGERQPQAERRGTEERPTSVSAPLPAGVTESAKVEDRAAPDALGEADRADEDLLAFMQDLAEGMEVDAAGASLHPGAAVTDSAVEELSTEERLEMRRLIQDAMAASGAS